MTNKYFLCYYLKVIILSCIIWYNTRLCYIYTLFWNSQFGNLIMTWRLTKIGYNAWSTTRFSQGPVWVTPSCGGFPFCYDKHLGVVTDWINFYAHHVGTSFIMALYPVSYGIDDTRLWIIPTIRIFLKIMFHITNKQGYNTHPFMSFLTNPWYGLVQPPSLIYPFSHVLIQTWVCFPIPMFIGWAFVCIMGKCGWRTWPIFM